MPCFYMPFLCLIMMSVSYFSIYLLDWVYGSSESISITIALDCYSFWLIFDLFLFVGLLWADRKFQVEDWFNWPNGSVLYSFYLISAGFYLVNCSVDFFCLKSSVANGFLEVEVVDFYFYFYFYAFLLGGSSIILLTVFSSSSELSSRLIILKFEPNFYAFLLLSANSICILLSTLAFLIVF